MQGAESFVLGRALLLRQQVAVMSAQHLLRRSDHHRLGYCLPHPPRPMPPSALVLRPAVLVPPLGLEDCGVGRLVNERVTLARGVCGRWLIGGHACGDRVYLRLWQWDRAAPVLLAESRRDRLLAHTPAPHSSGEARECGVTLTDGYRSLCQRFGRRAVGDGQPLGKRRWQFGRFAVGHPLVAPFGRL